MSYLDFGPYMGVSHLRLLAAGYAFSVEKYSSLYTSMSTYETLSQLPSDRVVRWSGWEYLCGESS